MDNLLKEIRRVQRRLAFQRFLGMLGWCWLAALIASLAVLGAARIWPLGIIDWAWVACFGTVGTIAAAVWTVLTAPKTLQAALEIDRRFQLKERISSTLAMNRSERTSEAGRALIADADARLRRIEVLQKFPVQPSRNLLLPLIPALLLLLVVLRPRMVESVATATPSSPEPPAIEVKKSADDLRQRLAERRKRAEMDGLTDASELLKKLEEGTKELQSEPQREKALVKLNDLARELQKRQKQLGGSEALKRELEKIESTQRGPGDKMAQALSKGEFEKAAKELEKLKKDIANSKLEPAEKEKLVEQFEQLKKKINEMAEKNAQAKSEMQKRADQLRQAGDPAAAGKLEEQLQKLAQQGPQMQQLQQLAQKFGEAAQKMQQGQNTEATDAMQQAMNQMREMAQQQGEMQAMQDAAKQLEQARAQMNCDKCGGKGCKECQGECDGLCLGGDGDPKDGKPGQGLGQGLGDGARPETKADGKFYDSKVRQKVGQGSATITGMANGPNLKGRAEAEIQKAATEVERGSTDPLSGQRLPRKQSEHAREYFDSFREGK